MMWIIGGITLNKKIKLSKRYELLKEGQDPAKLTADSLFKIINFIFFRVPSKQRSKFISKLRGKIVRVHPGELGIKKMPASSAIGQSIAITKNLLSGLNPAFINKVITELVKLLTVSTQITSPLERMKKK